MARTAHAQADAPTERYALANGLDVVLQPDRRLPLVAVNLTYHVGSMDDGEHPGLAHLLEHVMFRGSAELEDGELGHRLNEVGALRTNATTYDDRTSYHTLVPADQLRLALWLESSRMNDIGPAMTSSKVRQEMLTTIDEWEDRIESDVGATAFNVLWDALFPPGHPYRAANREQIRQLRLAHVRGFFHEYYGPANATLVLVGDLPPDVHRLVEHYFGRRKGGRPPVRPRVTVDPPTGPMLAHPAEPGSPPAVLIGWPSPGIYEEGDAEADVVASIIRTKLRGYLDEAEPDVFIGASARQVSQLGQSAFVLAARVRPDGRPILIVDLVDAALQQLFASITESDVRRAKRHETMGVLRGQQRLDARAARIQRYIAAGKDADWMEAALDDTEAIDLASIDRFVAKYLTNDRRAVVQLTATEPPR